MIFLCSSSYCALPGQHRADCGTESCRGCLPAVAIDGLYLCRVCVDRIGQDAMWIASLHEALVERAANSRGSGEPTSGNAREPGLDLDDELLEAKETLYRTLHEISTDIIRRRGWTMPQRTVLDMALVIVNSAAWIAGRTDAGWRAAELRDVRTDSRMWRIAYPARAVSIFLGTCPVDVDGPPCGGRLYSQPGQTMITCPKCLAMGTVEQWRELLTGAEETVVDAYAAAARLSTLWEKTVDPGVVKKWGQRKRVTLFTAPDPRWYNRAHREDCKPAPGRLHVVLRDRTGRTLYEWGSILAYATRIWGSPA